MKRIVTGGLIMLLGIFLTAAAVAGDHSHHQRQKKQGILLVAFGTSVPDAASAYQNIERKVTAAYPGIPVRWAYTSPTIRAKLAKKGRFIDAPQTALAKMMDEGFTHVAVQSLHIIPGEEFHRLVQNVRAFTGMAGGFESVRIGHPLLGTQKDLERVAAAMIKNIPRERKPADAVVLMGHGTAHPSNAFYAAMMFHFQQQDPHIFVGCVEGAPEIDTIKEMLLAKKIGKAYLMPFMAVAGDHALNDMAGDEADSWKSILTAADVQCTPVLKGMAEYDDILSIWVDHLGAALAGF